MTGTAHEHNPIRARLLYAELANSLRSSLASALEALFESVDDSLFDLTERSQDGESQHAYFVGMRECRKHKEAAIGAFLTAIGEDMPETFESEIKPDDLTLLSHDRLEQHLAVTGMSTRCNQQLAAVLQPLTLSVAALTQWPNPSIDSNPFGPSQLSLHFEAAIEDIPVSLEVRLILFKLFDRLVLSRLEPVYQRLLDQLSAAGISPLALPDADPPRAQKKTEAPPASAAQTPPDDGPRTSSTGEGPAATGEDLLLELLLGLVAMRGDSAPEAKTPVGGARTGRSPPTSSGSMPPLPLVKAIERAARRIAEGGKLPPPRQFAAQLLAEARYAGENQAADPAQAATVDLVGRLFDVVLQDARVAKPMQPVLHRMQAPLTRAALLDPRCLSDPQDPLHRAMDMLADVSLGWCRSADPEERQLKQIMESVDAIAAAPGTAELASSIAVLTQFLEKQQRRAEVAEQRVVDTASGRERLAYARQKVHQTLYAKLAQAPVSTWLRNLLTRPWSNYLVLLWLRNGEQSSTYTEAVNFVDTLLWCANTSANHIERLRMRAMLPVLETQLRTGLATVAYHDKEIAQLIDELREFFAFRLGESPEPAFLEAEPQEKASPGTAMDEARVDEDQPQPGELDPALIGRIGKAEPGTWFEFGPVGSNEAERAKLSWVSPYSGRYLFVNRNGMRVADRRPDEIVRDLEQDLARILENANLLQGALDQILGQLRDQMGGAVRGRERAS